MELELYLKLAVKSNLCKSSLAMVGLLQMMKKDGWQFIEGKRL